MKAKMVLPNDVLEEVKDTADLTDDDGEVRELTAADFKRMKPFSDSRPTCSTRCARFSAATSPSAPIPIPFPIQIPIPTQSRFPSTSPAPSSSAFRPPAPSGRAKSTQPSASGSTNIRQADFAQVPPPAQAGPPGQPPPPQKPARRFHHLAHRRIPVLVLGICVDSRIFIAI